jgi:hypothetical protein
MTVQKWSKYFPEAENAMSTLVMQVATDIQLGVNVRALTLAPPKRLTRVQTKLLTTCLGQNALLEEQLYMDKHSSRNPACKFLSPTT